MICIEGGRHPVIDLLLGEGEQYVPNNTEMSVSYWWSRGQGPGELGDADQMKITTVSPHSDFRAAYHDHHWTKHGREELVY